MPCRIYKERDELNQRVAALLASGNDEGAQKQLPAGLAQLRANLSSEMRAWSEQHFLVFRMLLSSTQVMLCSTALSSQLTFCGLRCIYGPLSDFLYLHTRSSEVLIVKSPC